MLLSICQNTFQSLVELEAVDSLRAELLTSTTLHIW